MRLSDSGKHSFVCKSHIKLSILIGSLSSWKASHHFIELCYILNDHFKGPWEDGKALKSLQTSSLTVYNGAYTIIQKKKNYCEQLVAEPEISNSNSALQVLKSILQLLTPTDGPEFE